MSKRILRRPAVQDKTGLKVSAIYERIANGTFPKPVKLGPRAVGWLESDVDRWLDELIARRDGASASEAA